MKVLREGREYFDGEAVGIYEGRFTGNFTMEESDGAPMSNDDLVTFIVTARVETPKFTRSKKKGEAGILKRSNAMRVESVMPMDAEKARWIYDNLSVEVVGVNNDLPEAPKGVTEELPIEQLVDDYFGSLDARQ